MKMERYSDVALRTLKFIVLLLLFWTSSFLITPTFAQTGTNDIVLYASKAPTKSGYWLVESDGTAAGGNRIRYADAGAPKIESPLASPTQYFEMSFNAQSGTPYRLWMRGKADGNSTNNDSAWVQFTGSTDAGGNQRYRIGTAQALNVNLATCADCALSGWGWQNRGYWEADTGEVWFSTSGLQTIRIQIREDGVAVDQIVLSPQRFVDTAPGPPTGDNTIVQK